MQSTPNHRSLCLGHSENELPRVLRRLNHLRRLSNDEVEEVFTGGPRAGGADGTGAPGQYPSLWAAIESLAPNINCEPRRYWSGLSAVRLMWAQAPALPTSEREQIKAIEHGTVADEASANHCKIFISHSVCSIVYSLQYSR